MIDARCRCGKILCQIEGVVSEAGIGGGPGANFGTNSGANSGANPGISSGRRNEILIKCRHCKRFMILYVEGPIGMGFADAVADAQPDRLQNVTPNLPISTKGSLTRQPDPAKISLGS
jgi:hypothetical protein